MWHKIFFNSQNIQAETEKACMIKMPNSSQYKECNFWHPKSLVREQGGKGYHCTFSFTDDFVFKVIKYGKGKHNKKDVIREYTLNTKEMFEEFGVVNEKVNEFVELETYNINHKNELDIHIEHHTPAKLNTKDINHDKTLMR